MFVNVDTGTIEMCDSSARVVDMGETSFVADGDDYVDDIEILNVAETDGVSVAELWAAYEWREALRDKWREALREAGIIGDIEELVARVWPNHEQVTA